MGRRGNCTWAELVVSLRAKGQRNTPESIATRTNKVAAPHRNPREAPSPAVTSAAAGGGGAFGSQEELEEGEEGRERLTGTSLSRLGGTTFTGTGRTAVPPQQELPPKLAAPPSKRAALCVCACLLPAAHQPRQPGCGIRALFVEDL